MTALLGNDWFDVVALFLIFALPSLVGVVLVFRDAREAFRRGRIIIGSRSGRDTAYERDLDPKLFWGTVVFKSVLGMVFLSFPALIFVWLSWSHWRSILIGWHRI
jgi:hypothetical protein